MQRGFVFLIDPYYRAIIGEKKMFCTSSTQSYACNVQRMIQEWLVLGTLLLNALRLHHVKEENNIDIGHWERARNTYIVIYF